MVHHRTIFTATPNRHYSIAAGRNLYLDTSAVRRLGTGLWSSPRVCETYTSVFTLIEILAEITKNEREFRIRRSAVAGVMGGDVAIDWQMPDVRLRCAFGPLKAKYDIYESRIESMQRLLACLAECEDLESFAARERELGLEHGLGYFADLDRRISQTHLDASRRWVPFNRQQFRAPTTADFLEFLGLPADASLSETGIALGGSSFDFGLALYSLTRKFSEEEGEVQGSEFHDKLFRGYDNSLDLFIRASSFQLWREIGRADMPGRNTAADLTHLQHVADGSYVVTTDIAMATEVLQAGGAVLGIDELGV